MIELTALPLSPAIPAMRPAGLALATTSDFALALADLAGAAAASVPPDAAAPAVPQTVLPTTPPAPDTLQDVAAPGTILPVATPAVSVALVAPGRFAPPAVAATPAADAPISLAPDVVEDAPGVEQPTVKTAPIELPAVATKPQKGRARRAETAAPDIAPSPATLPAETMPVNDTSDDSHPGEGSDAAAPDAQARPDTPPLPTEAKPPVADAPLPTTAPVVTEHPAKVAKAGANTAPAIAVEALRPETPPAPRVETTSRTDAPVAIAATDTPLPQETTPVAVAPRTDPAGATPRPVPPGGTISRADAPPSPVTLDAPRLTPAAGRRMQQPSDRVIQRSTAPAAQPTVATDAVTAQAIDAAATTVAAAVVAPTPIAPAVDPTPPIEALAPPVSLPATPIAPTARPVASEAAVPVTAAPVNTPIAAPVAPATPARAATRIDQLLAARSTPARPGVLADPARPDVIRSDRSPLAPSPDPVTVTVSLADPRPVAPVETQATTSTRSAPIVPTATPQPGRVAVEARAEAALAAPAAPAYAATPAAPRDVQPAARIFAQAMFAAQPATERDEAPSDALPISLLTGSAPTAPATPIAIHAAAAPNQSALDMSRADWMTSMIDRIETLRDESGGVAETRMTLSPDRLGNIDIALRRDDAGQIRVDITADTAQARTILSDAAPRLADMAEARGLKLGGAIVDAGAGGFTDSGRREAQQPAAAQPRRPASAANDTARDPAAATDQRLA